MGTPVKVLVQAPPSYARLHLLLPVLRNPSIGSLALGSTNGSIQDLFNKIKNIDDKHGKFDFALCVGDFFGRLKDGKTVEDTDEDEISFLLDGKLEAPIECYIMQGENPLPDAVIQKFAKTGGELCKNVFLMSKSGLVTTASGLRIACLGGMFEPSIFATSDSAPGFASPFFSEQTVEKLLSNSLTKSTSTSASKQNYKSLASIQSSSSSSQLVDILVTNIWPACITEFSFVPLPSLSSGRIGAPPLDDICRRLRPRYHFAAGAPNGGRDQQPVFWEREPFLWDDENGNGRASRFISLGAFSGTTPVEGKKQRWFYAFSISPETSSASAQRPNNVNKNPFTEVGHRKRPFQETQTSQGENYIFGDVRQPVKRSRIENVDGKPPPGYKCRRCDSTEHFINNCPDRQKPPEGYVCRICNTPGHLVRDCPSSSQNAVGDTGGRKPKEGYVCRACGNEGGHYLDDCPVITQRRSGGERTKRGPPKEIGPEECWFCLSNPNLAKHLIVSIGEECYVTLPKGQIVPTQSAVSSSDSVSSSNKVPGGGHVLIVPITHYPTYNTIPSDLAPPIVEETEKYKSSLRNFYAKHACHPVFFEISRISARGGRGVHAHVQCVPIPQRIKSEEVEEAFLSQGRAQGIDFENDAENALSLSAGGGGYFKVDLPDGKKIVHLMKPGVPFGIQFGRQVLTDLLGFPSRVDWKACTLSEEEDKVDAEAFKSGFRAFVSWA